MDAHGEVPRIFGSRLLEILIIACFIAMAYCEYVQYLLRHDMKAWANRRRDGGAVLEDVR